MAAVAAGGAAAAGGSSSWLGPAIAAGGSILGGLLGGGGGQPKQSNELQLGTSSTTATANSSQTVAFEDLFKRLYGDSFASAAGVQQNIPIFKGEAADLFSKGTDFINSLTGGGAGQSYLTSRLSSEDAALPAQLKALESGLGDLFNNQLNPAIKSNAVASGSLGGGREGVAQGVAAGEIAKQYQQGAAQLLASSQAQKDTVAQNLATDQTQAATSGLGSLQTLLGVAQSSATADILPQTLLQQILGGPTTLTTAVSDTNAASNQFGLTGRGDLSKLIPIFQGLTNGW